MLCSDCEQRFSRLEKRICENVFIPIHKNKSTLIEYDECMANFCASICWRVLCYFRHLGLSKLPPELQSAADAAMALWKDFLLEKRNDLGLHELHLLPVGPVNSINTRLSAPNLNRYFMRSVDMDIASDSQSAFVYVKMCRLMVFGFISVADSAHWVGTRITIPTGTISQQEYGLPDRIGEFINKRAENCLKLQDSMSQHQREKLDKWMRENPQKIACSESFRAMVHDVELFGDKAFSKHELQTKFK
jgi:hypothetical protein